MLFFALFCIFMAGVIGFIGAMWEYFSNCIKDSIEDYRKQNPKV
jgi:uncharacterized membrane protein